MAKSGRIASSERVELDECPGDAVFRHCLYLKRKPFKDDFPRDEPPACIGAEFPSELMAEENNFGFVETFIYNVRPTIQGSPSNCLLVTAALWLYRDGCIVKQKTLSRTTIDRVIVYY